MPAKTGFWQFVKAAFSIRPRGMFISPNWIALAVFGALGLIVNPGFLAIGAGLELAYLGLLATSPRFQRWVRGIYLLRDREQWQRKVQEIVARLSRDAQGRFYQIKARCAAILEFYAAQLGVGPDIQDQHGQSLNRFIWIFLQLLMTRQAISFMVQERAAAANRLRIEADLRDVEERLGAEGLAPELRKSLESQAEILRQCLQVLAEAENKLTYIDAELDRIENQVELIKEQAVVSKDSAVISSRIDSVSSSLGETTEWIKQQQNLFGPVQDIVQEPPPIVGGAAKVPEGQ